MTNLSKSSNYARNLRKKTRERIENLRLRESEILQNKVKFMALDHLGDWESISIDEVFKTGSYEAKCEVLRFYCESPDYNVVFNLDERSITIQRLIREKQKKIVLSETA